MDKTQTHIWSDVRGTTRLLVLWAEGQRWVTLAPGATELGRDPSCAVHVDHPSVSRRHLRLDVAAAGGCVVTDLGSANGTRVAGAALAPNVGVPLAVGQLVELGAVTAVLAHAPGPEEEARTGQGLDELLQLVAPSDLSVLILGETGAGKERIAEQIQRASLRAAGPFVRVNCAGFAETLLESELFGHVRGAFTGAVKDKQGLIEAADHGTLFLDEVGEMSPALQAKLLRAIDTRKIRRVGGVDEHDVDVRFLAATHRDLEAEARTGGFRSDLFYRLNGVTLKVPPLRERRAELPGLARRFAAEASARAGVHEAPFTPAALAALLRHDWPGNVRELKNVIERAVVLSRGKPIDAPALMLPRAPEPTQAAPTLADDLAAQERSRIESALAAAQGNQSRAAELLGIARRTLVKKLTLHGLPRPRKKS